MKGFLSIVLLPLLLMATTQPATAGCHFISLQSFKVKESMDVFSWGNFAPFIALEVGHAYPLAPEQMVEAPYDAELAGRRYYIPRHLIDGNGLFSLWLTVVDYDEDTPDDLVLPLTEKTIDLNDARFKSGQGFVTLHYIPFGELHPPHSNAQQFTFKIERDQGECNSESESGRSEDLRLRQSNELLRLQAHIQSYERYPGSSQEYLSYRVKEIKENRRTVALSRALDMASVNARELIALGDRLRKLNNVPEYGRVWSEYSELVHNLLKQKISLRYLDEEGSRKQWSVPSLIFHPDWKRLIQNNDQPVLPAEWGILLPGSN